MDHLAGLNDRQKLAATHSSGPLLIIAGAGAGKTKTISHRIVNLIKNGVNPGNILAVTFTNKAAKEMGERVRTLCDKFVGESVSRQLPWVGTFHTLGVNILRQHGHNIGVGRYFTILDKDESLAQIKKALKSIGLDPKNFNPPTMQAIISKNKSGLLKPLDVQNDTDKQGFYKSITNDVWKEYEKQLGKQQALDFDDLISKTVELFRKFPQILSCYQNIWTHIHVDEYQDTNTAQYELTRLLADAHKNICVVGDVDQAIYGWRNADYKIILNFEKNFPGATTILLEQNYRSTKNIIEAANQVISLNTERKEKNLFTENKTGEKIGIFEAFDESHEATSVIRTIKYLKTFGVDYKNIAVLYRANFQSRAIEEACINQDVPYQLVGTKFYERKEIKDVMAFLKASINAEDLINQESIINVPPRGIGDVTFNKIVSGQTDSLPPKMQEKIRQFKALLSQINNIVTTKKLSAAIKEIIKVTGIDEMFENDDEKNNRLENLGELVTICSRYDQFEVKEGLDKFLTDVALISDQDNLNEKREGIKLMTVHAAKGLEFEYVFVVGMEQDLFPYKRQGENSGHDDKEEERRLFYVAMTRAKEKLFLSYTQSRSIFGSRQMNTPSEFLSDIDDKLVEKDLREKFSPKITWQDKKFTKKKAGGDSEIEYEDDDIEWDCLKKYKGK
ncbi:MAG: UvrD-helicase domain-containing protein [Candidatus Paceibacterota bacterium]|jgi:DNA helicase-2/ATP-dependent DNA helicase PcrA